MGVVPKVGVVDEVKTRIETFQERILELESKVQDVAASVVGLILRIRRLEELSVPIPGKVKKKVK